MSFRGSRLTVGLLTVLVVVLLIGTGAAIVVSHQRQPTVAIATQTSVSSPAGSSSADASQAASPNTASKGTTGAEPGVSTAAESAETQNPSDAPAVAVTSNSSTAAGGPSNNLTVQMSSKLGRSAHAWKIQQLLQGYFDAINQHNYTGWSQSVTGKLAHQQNSAQWLDAYATTVDSSIFVQSMNDDPLQVRVRFTSQQDPDLAPKDLPANCIQWAITYSIESQHDHLAIGSTVPGSVTKTKC